MHMFFKICCFIPLFDLIYSQAPQVNTSRGVVVGFHHDLGNDTTQLFYGQADVFLGIPFVQPPIGQLRYAKPQRLDKFPESPYDATHARASCPQQGQNKMTEDCLYLYIYTPNASSTTKYPVMVWIHGGGLYEGGGNLDLSGTIRNFVSRGIVVVSIQYRLGFIGFFTTFTDDFPANLGMLDQVEALKFINEEISNFGGDPTKITIAGQSAGSASVSAHTYSPLSRGLFQQGIQESGTILTCFEGAIGPTNRNFQFANLTCNYTKEMWNSGNYKPLKDCMMNMDITTLYKYAFESGVSSIHKNAGCWNMVQDNYFMPDVPRNLAKSRPNRPMIIGTNKDEWAAVEYEYLKANQTTLKTYTKSYSETTLASFWTNFLGSHTQDAIPNIECVFTQPGIADDDNMAWLQFMVDVFTSRFFTSFVARDVENHLANNNPNVYVYEFTFSDKIDNSDIIPNWNPVPHSAELHFLFMAGWTSNKVHAADIAIANFFGESWTNFVKFGNPTSNGEWKPTRSSDLFSKEYYEIGTNMGMRTGYRPVDQLEFNLALPNLIGVMPLEKPDYNNGSTVN